METEHIAQHARADFDATIEQILQPLIAAAQGGWDHGLRAWSVGIRNEAGDVYRRVFADDLGEYVKVCEALKRAGFTDDLEDARPVGGFDSIFRQR